MQAAQVLKAPLFFSRLIFKLRRQGGGRDVLYILRDRLGMAADSAIAIGKRLKIAASPLLARRRFAVRSTAMALPHSLAAEGWVKFPNDEIEGAAKLARHCGDIFESRKDEVLATYKPPFGLIFDIDSTIRRPEEIEPIIRFCAQPAVFNLVSSYLGEYPVLASISFGYTAPNSGGVGSQLFHADMNEPRQLHLVMPISSIDMELGPFTFLPELKSTVVRKAIKHEGGRISDETLFSHVREDDLIYCTGEPGDVFFVNPYACLHCGARTCSKSRLILIINFTSLFQGVESAGSLFTAANRQVLDDGLPETRFLLNLQ